MFRPAGGFRQCLRSCAPPSVTSRLAAVQRPRLAHPEDAHHLGVRRHLEERRRPARRSRRPPSRRMRPSGTCSRRICARIAGLKTSSLMPDGAHRHRPARALHATSSTRRKYHRPAREASTARGPSTRPPKCRSSVERHLVLVDEQRRYGGGMRRPSLRDRRAMPAARRARRADTESAVGASRRDVAARRAGREWRASDVRCTGCPRARAEEARQQRVDAQQALARQRDDVVGRGLEIALGRQRVELARGTARGCPRRTSRGSTRA